MLYQTITSPMTLSDLDCFKALLLLNLGPSFISLERVKLYRVIKARLLTTGMHSHRGLVRVARLVF